MLDKFIAHFQVGSRKIFAAQHIAACSKFKVRGSECKYTRVGQQNTRSVEILAGVLVCEIIIHIRCKNGFHIIASGLLVVEDGPVQVHHIGL